MSNPVKKAQTVVQGLIIWDGLRRNARRLRKIEEAIEENTAGIHKAR